MNQVGARMIFENAGALIKKAGKSIAKAVLTQSYLRFEVLCQAGATNYTFDTLVNENTQTVNWNTQQKLNLQDAFVCSELGFFLAAPSSSTDTNFKLHTYPNVTAFAANVANYNTFYHGSMNLTVNQKVVVTNWDLSRHYMVPQTQQNMVLATYASVAGAAALPVADQLNLAGDGFYPVEPNLVMNGSAKNQLQIALPGAGLAAVTTNSRFVLIMRGILAQNVTAVN